MGYQKLQRAQGPQAAHEALLPLAAEQHGVVSRSQLLDLGLHSQSIKHRVATRRLHPVGRGIYAVGRPELGQWGLWTAALLSCGPAAALSHESAALLWGIVTREGRWIDVSVPQHVHRRRPGIRVHRRAILDADAVTRDHGLAVTTPACTLVDLATRFRPQRLEAAVIEADKLDLIDPEELRVALERLPPRPGVAALRRTLDRHTFRLIDSELERRFLRLTRAAGLEPPLTGHQMNGFKVDFHWPDLGLIVETDGLRYHRTPAQQARDRVRDQAHAAAGLTTLRFTHAQVRFEPDRVQATLVAVARRLRSQTTR